MGAAPVICPGDACNQGICDEASDQCDTNPLPDGTSFTLEAGQLVTLDNGVKSFVLSGIDPALMLDPLDNSTFVLGLMLEGTGTGSTVTQTALVVDTDSFSAVPLPPTAVLMLSGLGLFGFAARRRRRAA